MKLKSYEFKAGYRRLELNCRGEFMKSWQKGLLLGGAGAALAYALVKTQRPKLSLRRYYADKVAIVTGGASGIGRAIATGLYRLGAQVLVVDRDAERLAEMREDFPNMAFLQIDLMQKDAPQQILNSTLQHYGTVDLLFNNAGIVFAGPFLEMQDEDIERVIAINLLAQVRMTRAFLPFFLQKGGGVIAYTGSLSAKVYAPTHSVYTGTKGGLHNFVAALRRELPRRSSVQLTIVHPNVTRTNLVERELFDSVEHLAGKYMESAEEVAVALLKGIVAGADTVYVRYSDILLATLELLAPDYVENELRKLNRVYLHQRQLMAK